MKQIKLISEDKYILFFKHIYLRFNACISMLKHTNHKIEVKLPLGK